MARNDAVNEKLGQEPARNIGEIGRDMRIEQATERDVELTAFMEQPVRIRVHEAQQEGALDVITVTVNGINQNIIRGQDLDVKRKYIEALARCRTTTYEQRVQNPAEPSNIQMVPKTVLSYPFAVINDPHPKGKVWLDQILAQP